MAACRLLIPLCAALLLSGGSANAANPSCLQCHPVHYREKGSCVGCHRGDPRSDRKGVAHQGLVPAQYSWYAFPGSDPVLRGKKLLETFACRRCHTVAGKGNRAASNLDRLPQGTTPREISAAIETPALMMPRFHLDGRQRTDLVNALLAGAAEAAGRGARQGKEAPQVVHFQPEGAARENVFEKRCGGCHRALTVALGGVGRGEVGPNLSGLLTEHYPPTSHRERRWSSESLEKWLKNPRETRPQTTMRPISLSNGDLARLLDLFADKPLPLSP